MIIFLSYPIFDNEGDYLGLVGGTVYLKEENILQQVLGEHFYEDDSYVYVVDGSCRIIYHQNPGCVGDIVMVNPVVQQLVDGKSGAMEDVNSVGVEMLAGYATIPTASWGIVTQRPKEVALAPSVELIKEMILKTLPILVVSLLIILYMAIQIAHPLTKLATYAESSTGKNHEVKRTGRNRTIEYATLKR